MASSGHPNGPASQQTQHGQPSQQQQQHAHLATAPLSSYQQSHDSPQSAINTNSPHSGSKPTRILACVLCQHRKIKCDRTFPCANCIKANVTCTPSTPAPARKRRRPNQDLQERLARCEELLKVYASAKPDDDISMSGTIGDDEGGSAYDPAQQLFNTDPSLKWKPPGKLIVEDDGGVRFVDSFMLSTVHDELRAMRAIIEGEGNDFDCEDTPETITTPDENADLVLSGAGDPIYGQVQPSSELTLADLQPAPAHIFQLWQIYLERVNPLTKIIHVPTLQPYLVEASSGSHNLPQSVKTLLFAIFTLATVSMTPDECLSILGYSRETALQRFSNGVRVSLVRTNFLKAYDLETLQGLVIYLISLQGRYNRHAAWILNGVVLRIAQKMGMHRDGTVLGLTPFETEIRRRVWWQIIMVDAKYALMSGLSHAMLPRVWDTKEPKNVNDADLFAAATEPVQDREGPTEMIMVLVTNRLARFLLETPGVEPMILLSDHEAFRGPTGPSPHQVEMYRRLIANLAQSLEEITDKYCDPKAGSLHEMALDVKDEVTQKLEHLLLPAKEREFGDEVSTMTDNVFHIAVETAMHDMEQRIKARDQSFAWYSRLFFHDSMFLFTLGQLCTRTHGRLVEKAWKVVELTYTQYLDLYDVTQKSYYRMAMFVLRAWRTRATVLRARNGGVTPDEPAYVHKLRSLMPPQDEAKEEAAAAAAVAAAAKAQSATAGAAAGAGTVHFSKANMNSLHNMDSSNRMSSINNNNNTNNANINNATTAASTTTSASDYSTDQEIAAAMSATAMGGTPGLSGTTSASASATAAMPTLESYIKAEEPFTAGMTTVNPASFMGQPLGVHGGMGLSSSTNGTAHANVGSQLFDDYKMLSPEAAGDPVVDQFLTQPYMDPNTIDWDMWGNIVPSSFDNFNQW
ncbi:fungal specific transcription factor domain-containing protein [Ophiostoma piceae UAMH 11346]|uniref:Fungal specific transcription factor domain-containing protein n=1 Tax=Ophiostoma piceae (strain UAMH 11346) TaxID=1262450 RepID=S3CGJ6_OPHP1|nr:fungal specific transcription factor domain-containing protein [Ophiostoma piceae UAMH 11346]